MTNWREKTALNVWEVAKILGVSRGMAYQLVNTGELPALKLGKKRVVVPVKALKKFLGE